MKSWNRKIFASKLLLTQSRIASNLTSYVAKIFVNCTAMCLWNTLITVSCPTRALIPKL